VDRYLAQRTFSISGKKGAGRLPRVSTIRRSCREISHCGKGSTRARARAYRNIPGNYPKDAFFHPSAAGVLFISSGTVVRASAYTFAELRDSESVPVYYSAFWNAAVRADAHARARAQASLFSFSAHREIPQRTFSFLFAGFVYLHYHDEHDALDSAQSRMQPAIKMYQPLTQLRSRTVKGGRGGRGGER